MGQEGMSQSQHTRSETQVNCMLLQKKAATTLRHTPRKHSVLHLLWVRRHSEN